MKKIDIAYLAGVMDSDGWFSIKKSTYNIRVIKDSKNPVYHERCGIKQVRPEAVKIIKENFGGCYRLEKPSAKNGKPLHAVILANKKAHLFAKTLYPYMKIKRKQVEILMLLRKSLNEGKKGYGRKVIQRNQWGKKMLVQKRAVSPEQIKHRELLIKQIKALNDTRPWSYIPE